MKNKEIGNLLADFDQNDRDNIGMVVFDVTTGELIATTFPAAYVKKAVAIEQMIARLEESRILKLDPCGPKNWAMYSFGKKIVVTVRVRKDVFASVEYVIEKAPSAAIEDALEVALMVNERL